MQGWLGQVKPEKAKGCPNARGIRTGPDGKSRRSVRSLAKFGQLKPKIIQSCPKSSQVRTTYAKNHTELSEV
ncbi:hypothetical protein [Neobacillus cucumis]|uniref:hypothetical protein n=1 Tax=Neobacillus cucumis TaxID=1740721 RepID=UPI0019651D3A|nr:hypothetical protein [Neobacillus cucumis]MBM7653235.1 hypothetical protein [Neobacillus cucumis]